MSGCDKTVPILRRRLPQVCDDRLHEVHHLINIRNRRLRADREPQASVGILVGDADGGQYVTRLEGAAGTGGTGTRIDVLLVQEQQ